MCSLFLKDLIFIFIYYHKPVLSDGYWIRQHQHVNRSRKTLSTLHEWIGHVKQTFCIFVSNDAKLLLRDFSITRDKSDKVTSCAVEF